MRAKIIFDLVTVVVIGGGIELIQPYFGRSADWFDFAADVAGGVCGVLLAVAYARKRGPGVVDKL